MDARELTMVLNGRWHGGYGIAFCPAHGNTRTPALSLSQGKEGRILLHCHAGCGFQQIIAALRCQGLVDKRQPGLVAPSAAVSSERNTDAAVRSERARQLWNSTQLIAGSLAEDYLRRRAVGGELPAALRFHPRCRHPSGVDLPAMVALVEGGEGFAVHRTYLTAGGAKTGVAPAKAMLGPTKGGAVRLSIGGDVLVVSEGIETALSAAMLLDLPNRASHWACLSTSGMKSLILPERARNLIIAADGDAAGSSAALCLAERASDLGWCVSMCTAPHGMDWNDVLRKGGVA